VLEYEALIAKLNAELEIMRQQNVYFRDLSENLQQKELRQLDRGVAVVQPILTAKNAGVGNISSLERSGSTSSLHSNFSSISVLYGSRGTSSHQSLCHWKAGQVKPFPSSDQCAQFLKRRPQQQHQPYAHPQYLHQRGHHHSGHATLLAVSAPSTAFYNYSLPSFTGFRQLLWRFGT